MKRKAKKKAKTAKVVKTKKPKTPVTTGTCPTENVGFYRVIDWPLENRILELERRVSILEMGKQIRSVPRSKKARKK